MSDRLPILDELGRELVRAARHEEARGARAGRVGHVRRAILIGLLALLGLAAVAAAATLILGRGDPIPAPPPGLVPVELQPVPGSARLNGLNVSDPDGGPVWDVRTSRGKTGAVCATVGQVLDGDLGLLGLDRRFRALPAGAADTCSRAQPTGATLAGVRAFRGGGRFGVLTVVSGVAAVGVRRVALVVDGHATPLRLGPDHAFLAVLRGLPEELRPRVVLTEASGERTTLRFADTGEHMVGDPSGGAPWTLAYSMGRDGLRCVQARRKRGAGSPIPATVPKRCGPPDEPFVAIQRIVGPDPGPSTRRGQRRRAPTYTWVHHPARTVVWGRAPRAGGEVLLTGAGAPRRLRIDPGGVRRPLGDGVSVAQGGKGGFVAVLDGHVDPRRLRVSVDGRRVDANRTFDPTGRPAGRDPVPAWRPVTLPPALGPRDPGRIVAGSLSISRRASDHAGRPTWALRSWSIHHGPLTANPVRTRMCFTIGVQHGSRLIEPLSGGRWRTLGTGVDDRACARPRDLESGLVYGDRRAYVDDARTPDPRLTVVVVGGLLGARARNAELLGAGAPRTLALGRHGSFLVLLDPEHVDARLRIRIRYANGTRRTSRLTNFGWAGEPIRCVLTRGQSIRVADPDGGPSWMEARGRYGRHPCRVVGRAIGDRVAILSAGSNRVFFDPPAWVLFTRRPRTRNRPVSLHVDDPLSGALTPAPAAPSGAQVVRRSPSGRTVITGSASDDVASVTLRTPRDIRTVRPGPAGLLLAVYDGVFYGGQVHTVAHMRDGRTIAQTFPIGFP